MIGPETALGKHRIRAEWIRARACDILRTGAHDFAHTLSTDLGKTD